MGLPQRWRFEVYTAGAGRTRLRRRGYRYGRGAPMPSLFFDHLPRGFYCRTRDGICGPRQASAEAPRATAGDPRDFRGEDTRSRVRGLGLDSAWATALSRESCGRPREISLCSDTAPCECQSRFCSAIKLCAIHRRPPILEHSSRGSPITANAPHRIFWAQNDPWPGRISSESRSDIFALCQTGGIR